MTGPGDVPEMFEHDPMTWTGPEHLRMANGLLTGDVRWPHRIADRVAAAAVHVAAAGLHLQALEMFGDTLDPVQAEAARDEWFAVMRVPHVAERAERALAEWMGPDAPPAAGDPQGADR